MGELQNYRSCCEEHVAFYRCSGGVRASKEAGTSSQDAVCEECGAKVDYPLKNGKCQECQDEELENLNDDSKSKKTDDTYEGDGNKPKKGDKDTDNPW